MAKTTNTAASHVFSNVFLASNNAASTTSGAMFMSWNGYVHLWSNAIYANSGVISAAYLRNEGNTCVNGNTIVGNQLINYVGTGAGHYWLANNTLWDNEGYDVFDQNGSVDYAYNDIGLIGNLPPLSSSNELSVDPQFAGIFGVGLAPNSPLVNAGLDNPPGGVGSCCDPNHGPRVIGQHVDIGAYESDVLFRNGYESGS